MFAQLLEITAGAGGWDRGGGGVGGGCRHFAKIYRRRIFTRESVLRATGRNIRKWNRLRSKR
jgi:hypothetical protein